MTVERRGSTCKRKRFDQRGASRLSAKTYTEEEIREIAARQGLSAFPHLALMREKLSVKAKNEPSFRFYNLKRLVVEEETLRCAWRQVRANKGAPGVDGVTFEDIERSEGGVDGFSDDDRRHLGWPGRFADVAQYAVNFYSTGDEVLELYANNNIGILDGITSMWVQYSWHHQEMGKGRGIADAFGFTTWSGWGFDEDVYVQPLTPLPITSRRYTAEQAAAATDEQLRANPVFRPYPSSITNSVIPLMARAAHLTYGVPALTLATGRTAVGALAQLDNFNLNVNSADTGIPKPNDWPTGRRYGSRWTHSDMKDVAYYFNFMFYEKVIEKGGLK